MSKQVGKGAYMQAIEEKLRAADEFLRYGVMGKGAHQIRDDEGMIHTFSNIKNIASTMFDMNKGRDHMADSR